jgi:hypothetical protein
MNISSFKDFLCESTNEIKERIKLLILNSYLYEQELLNEKFIESMDLKTGRKGLKSKYLIQFNKSMRSRSIARLDDFQSMYLDNLSNLNQNFKRIKWKELNDIEFVVELDKFLSMVYRTLINAINEVNSLISITDFEEFTSRIKLETLKNMSKDFIKFRTMIILILSNEVQGEYSEILGNETKRIQKSSERILPKITLDIGSLEESGVDILDD